MIDLKKAIEFHGHLGPYLVLGLKAGELALTKLNARKYFGIEVMIYCSDEPPARCFVDGIQLSTGATYGKGNIKIEKNNKVQALIKNTDTSKMIHLSFTKSLEDQLKSISPKDDLDTISQKIVLEPVKKLFMVESSE